MKKKVREEARKYFKILLAEYKKESHLCSPEQENKKPEGAMPEGIEREQRANKNEKIKISKKFAGNTKRFLPLHSRNKRGEAESARLEANKMTLKQPQGKRDK